MPYTKEEGGRLNNFAIEPEVYGATPPTSDQQKTYLFLGVGALALVGTLVAIAVAVSSAS